MLTDVQIREAKAADRPYKLTDGGGLRLDIDARGGRSWVFRFKSPVTGNWVHTTLFQVPAHTRVNVTILGYDGSTPARNQVWGQVSVTRIPEVGLTEKMVAVAGALLQPLLSVTVSSAW